MIMAKQHEQPESETDQPINLSELRNQMLSGPGGIECPRCGCHHMDVRNSIPKAGEIRRYRVCRHCGYTRRTVERAG